MSYEKRVRGGSDSTHEEEQQKEGGNVIQHKTSNIVQRIHVNRKPNECSLTDARVRDRGVGLLQRRGAVPVRDSLGCKENSIFIHHQMQIVDLQWEAQKVKVCKQPIDLGSREG